MVVYGASFKARSNWVKNVGHPWGDGADDTEKFSLGRGHAASALHAAWAAARLARRGYADPRHPCRYQGSGDINTYKLFLEQSHALLRWRGALGMVVPSGIYSDLGARDLRGLFLERCRWEWLYAFQNERFVFEGVDHRFKVAVIGLTKGGTTAEVGTRFRLGPGGSPEASELEGDITEVDGFLNVPLERITQLSPRTRALLEVTDARDLALLSRIYASSVLLGDRGAAGWGLSYSTEFHMTNDAKLFPVRAAWEEKGYRPDALGRWVDGSGDVALPLYQGVMVHHFDFLQRLGRTTVEGRGDGRRRRGPRSGSRRSTSWRRPPTSRMVGWREG